MDPNNTDLEVGIDVPKLTCNTLPYLLLAIIKTLTPPTYPSISLIPSSPKQYPKTLVPLSYFHGSYLPTHFHVCIVHQNTT